MSMSKSKGGGCVTRGDSEIFLIGQPQESLDSGGKLPVSRKVLQYLKYLQSLPGEKTRPVKTQICCPLQTKTNTAVCSTGNTGCSTLSGNKCVVAAVTSYWRMAGIPTVTDVVITKYIVKLHEEWKDLCKHKNKVQQLILLIGIVSSRSLKDYLILPVQRLSKSWSLIG